MPFDVSWYEPGKTVYIKYTGIVSLDEVKTASIQSVKMLENTIAENPKQEQYLVHAILDQRDLEKFDFNVLELVSFMRNEITLGDQGGYLIVIVKKTTAGKVTRFFSELTANIKQYKIRTFYDMDSAIAFLHEVDEVLSIATHAKEPIRT